MMTAYVWAISPYAGKFGPDGPNLPENFVPLTKISVTSKPLSVTILATYHMEKSVILQNGKIRLLVVFAKGLANQDSSTFTSGKL